MYNDMNTFELNNIVNKAKKPIENVAIYIRVSSQEQAMFGFSLEAQKNALIRYAQENNMNVVGVYSDEGLSARTELHKRKALWTMVDDIRYNRKRIDKILFIKIDRWMRSMQDYYKVQEILDKHKVEWQCTQDDYTSKDTFKVHLYLTLAQEESDRIGNRIDFVFYDKLKKGKVITGAVPRGYKINKEKMLEIDEEEAEIIRIMFDTYEKTGSIFKTLKYLKSLGTQKLDTAIIRKYLRSKMFIGTYEHKVHGTFEGYCPAIISKEQFYRVNKMLDNNVRKQKYSKNEKKYIFQGMLYCNECKKKLSAKYQKRNRKTPQGKEYISIEKNYHCYHHYNTGGGCTNNYHVAEKVVEKRMMEIIRPLLENKIKEIEVTSIKMKKDKGVDYAKKIKELEDELDRISQMYRKKMMRENQYEKQFVEINKEIEECEIHLNKKNETQKQNINNEKVIKDILNQPIEKIYWNLTEEERRVFWLSIIDKIYFDRDITSPKFL